MKSFILLFCLYLTNPETFSQTKVDSPAVIWTESERDYLLKGLERTRNDVFAEIKGLSTQQWHFKENPSRWSIAEIIEHLTAQDEKYYIEIIACLNQPELPDFVEKAKGNDQVYIDYVNDPLKADAGAYLSPFGRYYSKEKTEFAYDRIRNFLNELVKNAKADFRKHFSFRNYKFDGHLTAAEKYNVRDMHQLLLTCISHTERHLNQVRQVKSHVDYPKQ